MKYRNLVGVLRRPVTLATAIAALVFVVGASAGQGDQRGTPSHDPTVTIASDSALSNRNLLSAVERQPTAFEQADAVVIPGLYIVQMIEPPVAQYRGQLPQIAAIPRLASRGNRADTRSTQARRYADHLSARQDELLEVLGQASARPVEPIARYGYAFNGFVARLDAHQLDVARSSSAVKMIEPVTTIPVDTDTGPSFIGAPSIWNGTSTGAHPGSQGEGIVIGVIDSGVNWSSPSFGDVGADGYDHTNPMGSGNYLGVCATEPADPVVGPNCNDKVIGAYAHSYEFVQQVNFECANPTAPGNELGLDPATCTSLGVPLRDFPNALDQDGHGSHTASTAAGNHVDITYRGTDVSLSGVAPHANLIVYDACHTNSNGQGSCFNYATLAAIEQVVADGIVDVVNYSIGGGSSPWTQANSQAFLAAVDAGVFIAASGGNSGPGAGTVGHLEPWVSTTAASTHTRGAYFNRFTASGTATAPAAVVNQPLYVGAIGAPLTAAINAEPYVISPLFDATNDGCTAYPADTFAGAVAIIRRGTCGFDVKAINAGNAGAIAVVIANNTTGGLSPGLPTNPPAVAFNVFGVTQAQGDALRDYINLPANAGTANITIPLGVVADPVQGDVMASFSSRGPGAIDVLKPDVTGPGVNILAAYTGADPTSPVTASDPDGYAVISGTSMSSPHNAGAAALVRAIHPTWTVAEVKSAMMLTSKRSGITKEDGVTPSSPFDRGAGRLDLNVAAQSGLVMNETPLKMFLADPDNGGDPSSLNIPSLMNSECVGSCSWTRKLRSVASTPVSYTASFNSTSNLAITVTPPMFTINPGQSITLTINADTTAVAEGQYYFGDLVLEANVGGPAAASLHMPVAVFAVDPAAKIVVTPANISASAQENGPPVSASLDVANNGTIDLNWTLQGGGVTSFPLYSQLLTLAENPGSGFSTGFYSGNEGNGVFLSDSFTVAADSDIGSLYVDGFVFATQPSDAYSDVTFHIFPDAGGKPAGNPQTSPAAAVWTYTSTIGDPGLSVEEGPFAGSIHLDLVAAGESLNLPAGKYWLVVAPIVGMQGAPNTDEWFWMGTGPNLNLDDQALLIDPGNLFGIGLTSWTDLASILSPPNNARFRGLSFEIEGTATCGAPWLSASPLAGTLAPGASEPVTVMMDPAGLMPAVYQALLCFGSNDPANPLVTVPVTFTVTGVPTDPSATGLATPAAVMQGGHTVLTVDVVSGTYPDSSAIAVTADLTAIGGSAAQAFADDGLGDDAVAGDNIFTYSATVDLATPVGALSLPVTVTDGQARSATAAIDLTITPFEPEIFSDGFED